MAHASSSQVWHGISPVMREYLAEVYRAASHQPETDWVTTSALAERMHVSPPAVARMVARLKRRGLLAHAPYQGMRLTAAGYREAMAGIRLHRLVEIYLVRMMGFGWHEVHEEADAIAPTMPARVAERMGELAGHPQRCPHGEPIPTPDGRMPLVADRPLCDLILPATRTVSRVVTAEPECLIYLHSLNLVPGQTIDLIGREPFGGPLRLQIGAALVSIGLELARLVRVCLPEEFDLAALPLEPLPDSDPPHDRA